MLSIIYASLVMSENLKKKREVKKEEESRPEKKEVPPFEELCEIPLNEITTE